ncbi:Cubilin [Lamellibrachia satsuma]|nr:Cubilin [Lamellibrachia satsuma]
MGAPSHASFWGGCRGSPATKQGPKGTIGINEIHYDNYMTCGWKIQVDATKRVQLHFLSFELEASSDCSFDTVNIYDGHDTSAPLLHSFCGDGVPDDVASSGNTMFVHFKTDQSGTYGGFNIYYSAFVPVDGCPGTLVEMRGSAGTFGISDDQYHTDMRCSWKIQVDPFKRVRLHFLGVHLKESTGCSYDSIKIYDGKDTKASLMRNVCGTTVPEDITSSTHTLFIHFSSGDTSVYSAFQIYYSDFVVPGGCHGNAITMRRPMGNFGVTQVQYTNYMRCNWNIQVNSTDIVKLEFVEFSVESCCDSVTVYDGDSRSAPLLGTFRGNTLPRNVFSTNNTMLVYFESDGSGTWNGFEINYASLPLATVCPDGLEIGPGGLCFKCSHGKYRRHGVEQRCTQCPRGWTTPTEMSVTVLNCTVPDCQPGEMSDGQKCTKCPRGTYQPDRWMTACVDCPLNHTTLGVGSINIKDCKWQCESGLQFDDVTGQCVLCPWGFFKDKALHVDCQPCPSHLTTPGRGSMSASDCSLAGCQQGAMTDGQNCSKCPRGTCQPDRRMTACVDVPLNHTIRGVGSDCKYTCDRCFCLNCGMCKENIPQNPEYNYVRSELQSDVPSTTHIVGACFGVFVLLLVSVVGFVLCYRRRRRDNCSETAPIIPTQQVVGECNETCEVHDTGV